MNEHARAKEASQQSWTGRPWLAFAVRLLVWIAPVVISVVASWWLGRVLPQPGSWFGVVGWWVVLGVWAAVVMTATDRLARRLLPLAALFKLSLVFPDQAPSRFKVALRTGTVKQLEEQIERVQVEGLGPDPIRSAERLIALVAALSRHDRLTRGHSERVRAYARMVGDEMRLDKADLDRLHWAALLHDVGKLFVPGEILNKPGRLTDDEYEIIKTHPGAGAQLCEPLRPWLGDWVDAVGEHHEKWDGTGYPNGTSGTDISLAARIVAVADVFDVITSARSYKKPRTPVKGREEIARCAGSHFDPSVVRAFLSVSLGKMRLVMGPLSWIAHAPVVGRIPLVPAAGVTVSTAAVIGTLMVGGFIEGPTISAEPEVVAVAELGDGGLTPAAFTEDAPSTPEPADDGPLTTDASVTATTSPDAAVPVEPAVVRREPPTTLSPTGPVAPASTGPKTTTTLPKNEPSVPATPATSSPTTTLPRTTPAGTTAGTTGPATTAPAAVTPNTTRPAATLPATNTVATTAAPSPTSAPAATTLAPTTAPPTTTAATTTTTTAPGPTTTISASNSPPIAANDYRLLALAAPININVLANDSDPDGDLLQISGWDDSGTSGSVSCSATRCTYAPQLLALSDSFTYTVSDGRGGTDTATVTIALS